MLVRTAFAEILQLADDDVFGRSKHERLALKFNPTLVSESPRVQLIPSGGINIGLEAGVHVDDVEMATLLARNFGSDDFGWRQVEINWRKNFRQSPPHCRLPRSGCPYG